MTDGSIRIVSLSNVFFCVTVTVRISCIEVISIHISMCVPLSEQYTKRQIGLRKHWHFIMDLVMFPEKAGRMPWNLPSQHTFFHLLAAIFGCKIQLLQPNGLSNGFTERCQTCWNIGPWWSLKHPVTQLGPKASTLSLAIGSLAPWPDEGEAFFSAPKTKITIKNHQF